MNNHVTVLEIDGKALEHNLNYFKGKLQTATKVLAVVKAFGYGSDGVQVARFLEHKVDYFAVAYTHEGVALREAGVQTPILVLHPHLQNLQAIIDFQLEPGLYNFTIFNAFLKLTREKSLDQYPVHLKFNTGLNRLGFSAAAIPEILMRLKMPTTLKIQSLFSHLAASEDAAEKAFTSNQIEQFTAIKEAVCAALAYTPMLHLLNTSGVVNYPQAQFDICLLYTSPSPRDRTRSRMPSSA